MKEKTIMKVQIPNDIIINREVDHATFFLYVELKRAFYKGKLVVYPYSLKEALGWKDNRKLKSHFNKLYELGLIKNEVNRINPSRPIDVELTEGALNSDYTQVDIETLDKIKRHTSLVVMPGRKNFRDVQDSATRLFYYYEKNYNHDYGKAFPTYLQISEDTRIHSSYIQAINEVFDRSGLVKIRKGTFYQKLVDGRNIVQKSGNEYRPVCQRV